MPRAKDMDGVDIGRTIEDIQAYCGSQETPASLLIINESIMDLVDAVKKTTHEIEYCKRALNTLDKDTRDLNLTIGRINK